MSVTVTREGDVALLTMDDGKANAVSPDLLDSFDAALEESQEASAIVIAGRAGRFSAGFDLKIMQGATPEEAGALVARGGALAQRLFAFDRPVVAACTGHALAMGAILLMACDMRIGTAGEFKIGLNETAIGMTLPNFGFVIPKARLATDYVTRAVVMAELFDPETARAAGFLDEVVAPEVVVSRAIEVAAMLGQLPRKAYHGNKRGARRDAIAALEARLV